MSDTYRRYKGKNTGKGRTYFKVPACFTCPYGLRDDSNNTWYGKKCSAPNKRARQSVNCHKK